MKYIKEWALFESYNSVDEFVYFVVNSLKKYNIFQSEMTDLIDRYYNEIEEAYNNGKQPFQVAEKIAKDLNLDSGGLMQYRVGGSHGAGYQEIKYL
jgi:hypothetical protein